MTANWIVHSALQTLLLASSVAVADGIVILDFDSNQPDTPYSFAVGSSGRIYAEVTANSFDLSVPCGIFALDAAGTLVNSFGTNGRLAVGNCANDLKALPNDSFIGLEYQSISPAVQRLVQRDATGVVTLYSAAASDPTWWRSYSLARQADGKILVGGTRKNFGGNGAQPDWRVARFNADGTIDSSFSGGYVDLDVSPGALNYGEAVSHIVPLASGKILVSGSANFPGGSVGAPATAVARLNSDGTVDTTFATNGSLRLTPGSGQIGVDSSGRVYVQAGDRLVTRLDANGAVDAAYAGGTPRANLNLVGLAVDSADRAVVFGSDGVEPNSNGYLGRFTTAGDPDTSFAGTGEAQVVYPRTVQLSGALQACRGALTAGDKPLLACSIKGEADPGFGAYTDLAIARYNSDGTLDVTFGAAQPDSDIYPDAYLFAPATADAGTANVQSNTVTITGFNQKTSIALYETTFGSGYSIGCTGTFTTAAGTISAGQTLCVRHHASLTPGGIARTRIIVGERRAEFVTTSNATSVDTTPDAFSFTDKTETQQSATITSDTVTLSGLAGVAPISVSSGGAYSIGCTQTFTTTAGVIQNGNTVCVRHMSSAQLGATTNTALTIGGVSDTFSSTTQQPDSTPDAFSFTDQTGAATGTTIISNRIVISGLTTAASISVTGGEYTIGNDVCPTAGFTSAAGAVNNGDSVCVRHISASTAGTSVTTTLTVGGVSDTFTSTTASASVPSTPSGTGRNSGGGGAIDPQTLAWMAVLGVISFVTRGFRARSSQRRSAAVVG